MSSRVNECPKCGECFPSNLGNCPFCEEHTQPSRYKDDEE